MSGGFFRGTSADQDTRFSNKQAKLLKSQKFAPELEHLVDVTKVKMEVMKPWIGRRVTELLGFEDEVLINFIFTLLEGKAVNGKEMQIQLTGFMEKNTGKFMKELWGLLISAQQTASGVPQQFLDAKAEELQKKEADDHRILNKIEKRMDEESKELQLERSKKMDNGVEEKRATNFDMELGSGRTMPKDLNGHNGDDKDIDRRSGMRPRSRFSRSPPSAERSRPSPRDLDSQIRRSVSQSRSHSGRKQSRSASRSPASRRLSISSDRAKRSSRRRSNSPRARHSSRISLSPSRRRSYFRRRSRSPLDSRSPSPAPRRVGSYRHKSPSPSRRRRSISPGRHPRSPSPSRRRRSPSPIRRRRSPSPARRRRSPSPSRHRRSPSPSRRRRSPSPSRRRRSPSPSRRHISPLISRRRRSPSPSWRRRSPMPSRRRRSRSSSRHDRPISPVRHRRSPSPVRHLMRSPSPPNLHPKSPSPGHGRSRSPLNSRPRDTPPIARRMPGPLSPRRYPRSPSSSRSSSPSPRKLSSSPPSRKYQGDYRGPPAQTLEENVRPRSSSMRDPKDQKDMHREVSPLSPSPEASPQRPKGPSLVRTRNLSEERRSYGPNDVPPRQRQERLVDDGSLTPQRARERNARNSSPDTSKGEEAEYTKKTREDESRSTQKLSTHSPAKNKQKVSPVRVSNKNFKSVERSAGPSRHAGKSEKPSGRTADSGASDGQMSPTLSFNSEEKRHESNKPGKKSDDMQRGTDTRQHELETIKMVVQKPDRRNGSDSEETGKLRSGSKDKKHKRSHRRELESEDESNDSEIEDRKESKKRRKEEKKMRKEEKRRRREERRRRKKERRAEKLKLKDQSDASLSDDAHVGRQGSPESDNEKDRDEQKKLEIELRNKALELYKAKKGINR